MSKYKLLLTPAADQDLTEIHTYIVEELANPDAAINTISKIIADYEKLADFPFMGTKVSVAPSYRMLVSGNYHIFYRVDEQSIIINRVLYGKRDFMNILFMNN